MCNICKQYEQQIQRILNTDFEDARKHRCAFSVREQKKHVFH